MKNYYTTFLIDDDKDDALLFDDAVKMVEMDILHSYAGTGWVALDKLNADTDYIPDIIFLDLNMPLMNGWECLSEIRKLDRLNNTQVYMYSTSQNFKSVNELLSLGASGFIVKPNDMNEMVQVISRVIKLLDSSAETNAALKNT